jgi:hypothetical protein
MGVEGVGAEGHQAPGNPGADRAVVCVDELDEEVDTDRQGERSGDDEGVFETESRQAVPEPGQQREQRIEGPVRRIAGRGPGRHRVIAIEEDRTIPEAVPATEGPQSQRLPKNPVSVAADEDPSCDLAEDRERQSDQDLPPTRIQPASRPVRPRGRGTRLSHECSVVEAVAATLVMMRGFAYTLAASIAASSRAFDQRRVTSTRPLGLGACAY